MIIGLTHRHYVALGQFLAGKPLAPEMQRHFEVKGWVRGGRLTDDGEFIWRRAIIDPPAKAPRASAADCEGRSAGL
jgi:hypothetical protein